MATEKRCSCLLLDYINRTATASNEDDIDYLLSLMSPTDDREEMGQRYNDVLGYNPLTYFDERHLDKAYDMILRIAPKSLRDELVEKKDKIIESVIAHKGNLEDGYLSYLLVTQIAVETGWKDPSITSSISQMISSEFDDDDSFEIDSDEELDDGEDTESDLDDDDGYYNDDDE